jgi:hypothetical protein
MNLYIQGRDFQFQFICYTIPITLSFSIMKTTVGTHTDVRKEIQAVF